MRLFVIYHDPVVLKAVPDSDFIAKYLLSDLDIPSKYQNNCLAENRFLLYLSEHMELLDDEYVGIAAASWNEKYSDVPRLEQLAECDCSPEKVLVPQIAKCWYSSGCLWHAGIERYLDPVCERNGFRKEGVGFWSNNFVCHSAVMRDFLKWWRKEFLQCFEEYGFNMSFGGYPPRGKNVYKNYMHPAYFYERLTTAYFANQSQLRVCSLQKKVRI